MDLRAGKAGLLTGLGRQGKAVDQFLDLADGQRHRLAELAARQTQLDRRGGLGMAIDVALRLPPACQRGHHRLVRLVIDNHIAGAFEMVPVDLDIAAQQHPRAAIGPGAVEPVQLCRGHTVRCRQAFGHRGLGDPVGQGRSAGKGQRIGKGDGHGKAPNFNFD